LGTTRDIAFAGEGCGAGSVILVAAKRIGFCYRAAANCGFRTKTLRFQMKFNDGKE
jgi:hypothetical protein